MATSAEYGLGEYAFPRGWFAVAESSQVKREPFNIHYFGQDMVLYRGESGRVVMLDAYCPHMGTHLGMSKNSSTVLDGSFLEGDSIRCPFHAWRFGPDGRCNHIPYFDGPIPEAAQIKSWPIEERWGIVFCWHDPEGQTADFPLPDLPEWDDAAFVRWTGLDHVADLNHPIEILDNMSDAPHLNHLHGSNVVAYENEVEGYMLHQRETMVDGYLSDGPESNIVRSKDAPAEKKTTTIGAYYGPGVMLARFIEAEGIHLICHTPVEDGESRLWSTGMMKSPFGEVNKQAIAMRRQFGDILVDGLRRDGEVWMHKRPALKIMQLPTDGPFGKSRRWYSQFYNPRAKTEAIVNDVMGKHFVRGIAPWCESEYACDI